MFRALSITTIASMRIHLEIDSREPLTGRLTTGDEETNFHGWLDLLRLLSDLLARSEETLDSKDGSHGDGR
jgi:hypothetical protein